MTKDDKEFFDKVMIAALNGFICQGENARWEIADASDIAEKALKRRNVVLQELGYQEPPQAQIVPDLFGSPAIPVISGDLTPSTALKEHLHGNFDTAKLTEKTRKSPPTKYRQT